jgi:hypothetical protein
MELLVRVVPWVVLVALVLGGGYFLVDSIYDSGYESGKTNERKAWQDKQAALAAELALSMQRVAAELARQEKQLLGVIDEKSRKNRELDDRVASLLHANRGLWVDRAKADANGAATGKACDSGLAGGGTGRARLPENAERFLRARAVAADKVVIQYEACRAALKNITVIAN